MYDVLFLRSRLLGGTEIHKASLARAVENVHDVNDRKMQEYKVSVNREKCEEEYQALLKLGDRVNPAPLRLLYELVRTLELPPKLVVMFKQEFFPAYSRLEGAERVPVSWNDTVSQGDCVFALMLLYKLVPHMFCVCAGSDPTQFQVAGGRDIHPVVISPVLGVACSCFIFKGGHICRHIFAAIRHIALGPPGSLATVEAMEVAARHNAQLLRATKWFFTRGNKVLKDLS